MLIGHRCLAVVEQREREECITECLSSGQHRRQDD